LATETKLRQLAQGGCPVYYFYSSERYLVRQAVARAAKLLAEGEDEETTVLDGAAPEIEQLIMAAGTISFFGTRRVVLLPEVDPAAYSDKDLEQLIMAAGTISFFGTRRVVLLPEVDPAAYSDKDLDELCATLASLENAVVVLGSVFEMERNKLKLGKRAQKLIAQCTKVGFAEELAKPKPYELKVMVMDRAKAQDTTLSEGTAAALLERCGEDPFLLENEVDKLCALSGYQTVTTAMVAEMGTVSLEADVFEMIRMITAKNATGACKKLQTLLRLQQEPIPITAAMIGSYVDLYRVKLGAAKRKSYSTVFKDFGYKGSDYRLKRSAETASHYTLPQLEACMQILLELDKSLKSQPVSAQTLLETALCRLAMAGGRR
jgi:DNA polymerase-3 subunit delta